MLPVVSTLTLGENGKFCIDIPPVDGIEVIETVAETVTIFPILTYFDLDTDTDTPVLPNSIVGVQVPSS